MRKTNLIALVLTAAVLFFAKTAVSQNTTFKLTDYKNPTYIYQTLDLNFGLNSGLSANKESASSTGTSNAFSLNSSAGGNFSRFTNSPKAQSERHINLNTGIGSNSSDNDYSSGTNSSRSKNNTFSHSENVYIDILNRYYNPKQNYIELNGGIYSGFQNNSEKSSSTDAAFALISHKTESQVRRFFNRINGSILIGNGRIEKVQDARLALYILNDLHLLNRDKRSASDTDVMALAQLITSLKYKRFFDTRLQKIAQITAIDSFIQKNGIVGTPDAAYFTSLNDNWDYANGPARYSGRRMFTGFEADYSYRYGKDYLKTDYSNQQSYNRANNEQTTNLFLVFGITKEKPLSLIWQKSTNLKVSIGIQNTKFKHTLDDLNLSDRSIYTDAIPAIKLTTDYGYGYYPNSRTYLTLKLWFLAGYENGINGSSKKEKTLDYTNFYTYTGPQFQAYYYLSERLRLNFTFNGEFRLNHYTKTYTLAQSDVEKSTSTWWNQQVNASLTYSLF